MVVNSSMALQSEMTLSRSRHLALHYCWSMIFSENRYPPRIKPGAGFFGIML
jgi:hypothetical protein